MANVVIAVMSAKNTICSRNIEGIKDSYVRWINEHDTKHKYTVVVYEGVPGCEFRIDNICENMYRVTVPEIDDVYHTYEKTRAALTYISKEFEFDYIVRANISAYISIKQLDLVIDQIGGDIYCNAINAILTSQKYLNDIYPRGDFWMMSKDTFSKIDMYNDAPSEHETLDRFDDVLFGVHIIDAFGRSYVDKIKPLVYSYIPGPVSDCNTKYIVGSICTRVKGVPPGKHSGLTWNDNQYRKLDPSKMRKLYEIDCATDKPVFSSISDYCQDESSGRAVTVVQYAECYVRDLKNYLKAKK